MPLQKPHIPILKYIFRKNLHHLSGSVHNALEILENLSIPSEEVVILTLKDPINVNVKGEDNFNEPEQGVRELQVVFSDSMSSANHMKEELVLRDTLFHAHTVL